MLILNYTPRKKVRGYYFSPLFSVPCQKKKDIRLGGCPFLLIWFVFLVIQLSGGV